VEVVVPPLIGVLTTGTELRNPGEPLKKGQIYNSNGYQLCSQVANMGGRYKYYGTTEDDRDTLSKAISECLNECGILLLTGGISMGDYDFVPSILQNLGVDIHFQKVAVKPGKPALFGSRDGHFVFGLPGNPVSAFVIFEVMVKPFFFKIMNIPFKPIMIEGKIAERISRKSGDRVEFRPVRWESGNVFPIEYRGSSHLHSLAAANGLIRIEKGINELPEGAIVDVRRI
jgi:molybdopterin molybdotransferase